MVPVAKYYRVWLKTYMPASLIELKNSLPDLDLNPDQQEPSARQPGGHYGLLIVVCSPLCHEDRLHYSMLTVDIRNPYKGSCKM